jgi:hypothetical protein
VASYTSWRQGLGTRDVEPWGVAKVVRNAVGYRPWTKKREAYVNRAINHGIIVDVRLTPITAGLIEAAVPGIRVTGVIQNHRYKGVMD